MVGASPFGCRVVGKGARLEVAAVRTQSTQMMSHPVAYPATLQCLAPRIKYLLNDSLYLLVHKLLVLTFLYQVQVLLILFFFNTYLVFSFSA